MTLTLGGRVRRVSGGADGVVLSCSGDFAEVSFPDGRATLHISDLAEVAVPPVERLAAGELGDSDVYTLRLQQQFLEHAYRFDPQSGLSNARVEPQPHQVFVAHRVVQKVVPRMILADEVGLGKTIEAGLILKELRARRQVERVLVVTPASLLVQWQHELASKFNEKFTIVDGAAIKFLGKGGVNPFAQLDNVLCSLPFAANAKRAEMLVEVGWDLVIFDEAHRVRRTRKSGGDAQTTQAYRLADDLKDQVRGLLLLTATPVQLHQFELYSLIELIEPGLLGSPEGFERKRRRLPELNKFVRGLQLWPDLVADDRQALLADHAGLIAELGLTGEWNDESTRGAAMDRVTTLHPLAGVMVRNRKSELGIVSERHAYRVPVQMDTEAKALYEDVSAYIRDRYSRAVRDKNRAVGFVMVTYQRMLTSSSNALRTSLARRAAKLRATLSGKSKPSRVAAGELEVLADAEEDSVALELLEEQGLDAGALMDEIESIDKLVTALAEVRDAKADALLAMLSPIYAAAPTEKVVIFTQFIETQNYLAFTLHRNGYKVAIFNGTLKPDDKETQIKHFRADAQILISTEAGGEGRNLQFCHRLVNYDLPWNPMKIEQRIGRLDRIGQKFPVKIYNLAYEGTVEDRVLDLLEHRIKLFEESVGALDPILGEVETDIERMVLSDLTFGLRHLEQYSHDLEQRVREARSSERMMSDFILDRASLRKDQSDALLERGAMARPDDLASFIDRALTHLGGTLTDHPEGGKVISLSPKLASRLGVRNSVVRGSFPPAVALELEELDFFAFGNEVVDKLLAHVAALPGGEIGSRVSASVPPGVWVELIYRISSSGARPRGYLIRHLVGPDGEVTSQELTSWDFADVPTRIDAPSWVAAAAATSSRLYLEELKARRPGLIEIFESMRAEEEARVQRMHNARRNQLAAEIKKADEWLNARSYSASDRDRRIMPARQGRLEKDRQRLQRLGLELESQLEEIRARRAEIDGRLLSVGLVRGAE